MSNEIEQNSNNSQAKSSNEFAQSIARFRSKFEQRLAASTAGKKFDDKEKDNEKDREEVSNEEEFSVEAFHPIDIERMRRDDWQIERFLRRYDANESVAYDAMIRALRWKKSFGVHDRDDHHFPAEFWQMSDAEICGSDRAGRIVCWCTIRNMRHFPELSKMLKQFAAHMQEKLDVTAGATGYVMVIDIKGAAMKNINLDFSKFTLASFEHYPESLRAMYVVDLPGILNSIMKLLMNLAPKSVKRLIHFVNRAELRKHIDPRHIPNNLGGDRVERQFLAKSAEPLSQCADRLRLEAKFVKHFYKIMKSFPESSDQTADEESAPQSESIGA